jgi:hypothetical protein
MEQNRTLDWAGHGLAAAVGLLMVMSAVAKLQNAPEMVAGMPMGIGSALQPIGVIEIVCALTLLIPQTRVLGAIGVAAYLGGAVVIHLVLGSSPAMPIGVGIVGLFSAWLSHPGLRSLIPFATRR